MTQLQVQRAVTLPKISWEKLPDDFALPDRPVENNFQPLLAAALRESLELAGLILESMLIASNFGICATVADQKVVKAPDWIYVRSVNPIPENEVRRSYTPRIEGDLPTIAIEFVSETDGGEYSINPHYPYGKWYFYEQILQVPIYAIFHPKASILEVYCLVDRSGDRKYEMQIPDRDGRYWIESLGLFLGIWRGTKGAASGNWLRWWDREANLLLWGFELVQLERQRAEQAESLLRESIQSQQRLLEQLSSLSPAQLKGLGIDLNSQDI